MPRTNIQLSVRTLNPGIIFTLPGIVPSDNYANYIMGVAGV